MEYKYYRNQVREPLRGIAGDIVDRLECHFNKLPHSVRTAMKHKGIISPEDHPYIRDENEYLVGSCSPLEICGFESYFMSWAKSHLIGRDDTATELSLLREYRRFLLAEEEVQNEAFAAASAHLEAIRKATPAVPACQKAQSNLSSKVHPRLVKAQKRERLLRAEREEAERLLCVYEYTPGLRDIDCCEKAIKREAEELLKGE